MGFEIFIKNAYTESLDGNRSGDSSFEVEEIRKYILHAKKIVVPNWNSDKISPINEVLSEYGLCKASHLQFNTNCCDLSRIPALSKALLGLDMSDCDLVIARGRLGVPGSGSLLLILDNKGRILSASLSPAHVLHQKTVGEAIRDELRNALQRIGF